MATTTPPPSQRPRFRRDVVRLLVQNPEGALLLIGDSDTSLDPAPRWWSTPGGGIEEGEGHLETAVRELWEETGFTCAPTDIRGPVAVREAVHGFGLFVLDQTETFYAVSVAGGEIIPGALTESEVDATWDNRWFSRPDLAAAIAGGEDLWPRTLEVIWDALLDPTTWPLQLEPAEESTIPAAD